MLKKIQNILEGWLNRIRPIPPVQKALFDDRLKICESNECGMLKLGVCTACGCPVKAKTKVLNEECPENMWNPVLYSDGDVEFFNIDELPEEVGRTLFSWQHLTGKMFSQVKTKHGYFRRWSEWLEFKQYLKENKL